MVEVDKLWGREQWLTNNDKYCMKILYLQPGYQSSLHYHEHKDETFLVIDGAVTLEVMHGYKLGKENAPLHRMVLGPLNFHRLSPGTPHRFSAIKGEAVIVEASTPHSDADVVRLEESRKI